MRRARSLTILTAAALAVPLLVAAPGAARADSPAIKVEVEEKFREGAAKIVEAITILLKSIPTYGVPRVDEDGNIIIPRRGGPLDKKPEETPGDGPEDEPLESTRT